MDTNIFKLNRDAETVERIREIERRLEKNGIDWVNGSVALATLYAARRAQLPSNIVFGQWLLINSLGKQYNENDRAALIAMGDNPVVMRKVLEETDRRSYQHIWREYQSRFGQVTNTTTEQTFIPETAKAAPVEAPTTEPARDETAIDEALIDDPETLPATPTETYPLPGKSKLRELIGNSADVLHSRFKHSRIFANVSGADSEAGKAILRFLAKRCQQPDYPVELFTTEKWSLSVLWPHLPKKFLDQMPASMPALKKHVTALHEVEARFVKTPEFGMTDPPMAATNKANAILNAVVVGRKGGTFDPTTLHKPTFDGDEGKPPVIICGTQVWPAPSGSGYSYADLRCAIGVTDDILRTFKETADASDASKSLKLRHILAWFPGGYNGVGNTLEGTHKALTAVVQAYSAAKSTEMKWPPPSLAKADGNEK